MTAPHTRAWQVPVTRLRTVPGPPDRYGEPGPGGVVETELPAALFAPAATSEPVVAGAAPVLSAPALYWRGRHPDVTAADRLRVNGTVYRVEGAPAHWPMGLALTLAAATDPAETGA